MSLIEENLVKLDGPFKKPSSDELINKANKVINRSLRKWFHSRSQPYASDKTGSNQVHRFSVTSDKFDWNTELEDYTPAFFESEDIIHSNEIVPRPENYKIAEE